MPGGMPKKANQTLGIIKKGIKNKKAPLYTTIRAYDGPLAGILYEAAVPKGWSRP